MQCPVCNNRIPAGEGVEGPYGRCCSQNCYKIARLLGQETEMQGFAFECASKLQALTTHMSKHRTEFVEALRILADEKHEKKPVNSTAIEVVEAMEIVDPHPDMKQFTAVYRGGQIRMQKMIVEAMKGEESE